MSASTPQNLGQEHYTKNVSILSAAAQTAGCTATSEGTGDEYFYPFTITYATSASAVDGWVFDHWEYRRKYTDYRDHSKDYIDPPYGSDPKIGASNPTEFYDSIYYDIDDHTKITRSFEIIDLTAVFVSSSTDLLIYLDQGVSADVGHLMYDPASGKLIYYDKAVQPH